MDNALAALAAQQAGIILRTQALDAGYSDGEIARCVARGVWVRVRRGAYAERRTWEALDEVGRHRARAHAVVRQLAVPAVPSHVTAAVLLRLPVWDADLSAVHVTRADLHTPRIEGGVHHHAGAIEQSELTGSDDGLVVTADARTAVDVARTLPFESAVVTTDAALARGNVPADGLLVVLDRMRDWRGARAAGRVVEFADGRSESVGESRHRVQLERIGLPRPELQVTVEDRSGETDRVDFYFERFATVGEFDGREKYQRLLRPGETPGDAMWREKRREDRLRERGLQVVRPVWADLCRDDVVAARYRQAFARARGRRAVR
ncbi:putative AbiEi antitoxin of type IV toxin-antitoxin system [Haloactinopolyspora alba]|uniref:Putative AbiEi antitoxin of type IV toxin-antitoxin system n=1 Tax=Haloactinopolyspora alba TaxID=648780 RepID=A0A2P8D9C6_9ACTN|nr:type IV toxin-antitoxin system AbiEi family antitoxin domain-containing protein [Haloactinopolyspora alba]PSK93819.1 putative AbiEi antitoxin of type IV toxin-antitoxin system [Haloactinopolyspora alba]